MTYLLKNIELNMMLIVLTDFSYIRHSWTLQQFQWIPCTLSRWWIWFDSSLICNIMSFSFICLWGRQICYMSWWLQNTGKHWNKVRHWIKMGWGIVETFLLASPNDMWYILVFLPQKIQDLYYNFSLVLVQWYIFFLSSYF